MKKVIALMAVFAMLCALFAGCGTQETPADGSEAAQQSENGSAEETLTVWCWDEAFNLPAMATAEKYYKEAGHDNFKLNIVNVI